jgi:DNA polymerase IV
MRKIVHVDMDAFYASVEQRDRPELRCKPVVVAWTGARSVVCAASYEARKFGVRSAMPALRAQRQCPQAVFVPPDFERYRRVSRQIREIFARHTPLVEPLSLDEAYLDVTVDLTGLPTATASAEAIRHAIREETQLTASAGVAPNKFLAKIASDWNKPDGLFVIKPHQVEAFLPALPVGRLPGVGHKTEESLAGRGIATVGDLRRLGAQALVLAFGKFGERLWDLAHGRDERPVEVDRPNKLISSESTFAADLPRSEVAKVLARLADQVWNAAQRDGRPWRTITVKLRTPDFRTATRRRTPAVPPLTATELAELALELLERFEFPTATRFRLAGIGVSGFDDEDRPDLQSRLF